MAETANIAEIANRLSNEIFNHFRWNSHPLHDKNFKCTNVEHLTDSKKPKKKDTHPGDVVFFYDDPYLGKRIYLHTDLKSYGKGAIGTGKLRSAIKSLAMTVECARQSTHWREIYSIGEDEDIDVRGLLFVHNHDGKYSASFEDAVDKTDLSTVSMAPHVLIHFLGPEDINRLYAVGNDLIRLQYEKLLPNDYTFYYPDMVMWHRQGDVWNQPATIELLTAPYFIIKYSKTDKSPSGYLIYYNRKGGTVDEFEYFLDSLSRYQMLGPDELIRIRVLHKEPNENFKSNFLTAVKNYSKAWGFEQGRQDVLDGILIDRVNSVLSNYKADDMGWSIK